MCAPESFRPQRILKYMRKGGNKVRQHRLLGAWCHVPRTVYEKQAVFLRHLVLSSKPSEFRWASLVRRLQSD